MLRFIAVLILSLVPALSAMAANDAADTVTGFHRSLLEMMRAGSAAGCGGRAQRLAPAIDASFDLPALAARVLRRQWPGLSEAQRKEFVASFRDLVIATYASRFNAFNGERFDTLDTVEQPGGLQLVHARLQPKQGDPVSFDYVLHPVDGHWKIINIIADGVSDLAIRSTQYEQIIKQRGYDGLLSELKSQTQSARDCK